MSDRRSQRDARRPEDEHDRKPIIPAGKRPKFNDALRAALATPEPREEPDQHERGEP